MDFIKNTIENKDIKYVFVLAGGQKGDGDVNDFVAERLDKSIELYSSFINEGYECIIVCLGGGTYHKKPQLDINGYVVHESSSCAMYLLKNGVPEQNIYREWSSYDTIANGYYAFSTIIIPLKIKEVYLVTSKFHIERVKVIFNHFNKIFNANIDIKYIKTENYGMSDIALTTRTERERRSKIQFEKNTIDTFDTLEKFTKWLYTEHCAYKGIIRYEIQKNEDIAKSY